MVAILGSQMTVSDTYLVFRSVLGCLGFLAPHAERGDPDALECFSRLLDVGQALDDQLHRKLGPLPIATDGMISFPIGRYRQHVA
jgi:hypothetical protein